MLLVTEGYSTPFASKIEAGDVIEHRGRVHVVREVASFRAETPAHKNPPGSWSQTRTFVRLNIGHGSWDLFFLTDDRVNLLIPRRVVAEVIKQREAVTT